MRLVERAALVVAACLGCSCNVEPLGGPSGGVSVVREPGCPAAAIVVLSDFVSSQVAISALDGETLSESFASTASSRATALSFPFSGDLVVPATTPASGRVVLVDRRGTNVVTWLDPATARVLAQLPVGTGFEANPQDYVELDERRALVTRQDENPLPGAEPFDQGGDVIVIDTELRRIEKSIALPREDGFPPRPGALGRIGQNAVVTLERLSLDFRSAGDGRLVGIDADAESTSWTVALSGLKNCGRLHVSPNGERGAVACSGFIDRDGRAENVAESGLVLFDVTRTPPEELRRFPALELAGEPIQHGVAFFANGGVLVKTQTVFGGASHNRLLALDLESGEVSVLVTARASANGAGKGVVYGGLLCTPGCGNVCLVADADRGVLQRYAIEADELEALEPVRVERDVGLPPRALGSY